MKNIKVWTIVGMILSPLVIGGSLTNAGIGYYAFFSLLYYFISIPLGIIGLQSLSKDMSSSNKTKWGLIFLFLVSTIAGILILVQNDSSNINDIIKKEDKKIICEVCGSGDIQKENGVFLCKACGTKYSLEEIKALFNKKNSGQFINEYNDKIKKQNDEGDSQTDTLQQQSEEVNKKKKKYIILGSTFLSITLIVSIILPIIIGVHRSNMYNRVLEYKNNLGDYNYLYVREYLNKLPKNYKDCSTLKEEFNQIDNEIEIIDYYKSPDGLNEIQSEFARESYKKLYKMQSYLRGWNIASYLKDARLLSLFFGAYWSESSKNLKMYTSSDGENFTLSTNLPNNKKNNKTYYFDYRFDYSKNGIVFSYTDTNYYSTNAETFDAYFVSGFTYNADSDKFVITVFCYSNSTTYTLSTSA